MHVSCPRLIVWPLFTLKPCMQIIYLFQGSVPKSFQPFWSQCHYGRNFQIVSKNYETLNKKNIFQCVIKTKIFCLEIMKTTFWVKVEFVCFTLSVQWFRRQERAHNFRTKTGKSKQCGWGETTWLVAF